MTQQERDNTQESVERLKARLLETPQWPIDYMFKFIVPNHGGKVDTVRSLLPAHGKTTFNHSKDLHYVAVTHVASMNSADNIIDITIKATSVEGVISL
jgi:hypothetical protein